MQKRMVISIVFLAFIFFLTSCSPQGPGQTPLDTAAALKQVQSGSQGVEVSLLANFPPPTLYDQDQLDLILEVQNKGNHDLDASSCFVRITGIDQSIIRGGLHIPRSCAERIGRLPGKSIYNIEGESNQLEIRSSSIFLPEGVFEYNPTLNIQTCYNYHTRASPQVCVDPALYQITTEQKVCTPRSVSMGGGQGAPVGISYVGVNMVGARAVFEINVQNFGVGKVLSPYSDLQSCGQPSPDLTDLDRVAYSVQFSGGSLINCSPAGGLIRLNNGNGKIVCSFNVPGTGAFESPLLIDLDYNYMQSFQKSIRIVKTPQ
ncbi:hypothetical protein J4210_01220 [Candidatus Woesearchaeota archaeon]|nr:hypothetical protein [Candidatus Woesearchaeota archaeon]